MASITTATSGNSNDPATWTGGVVPGTTFAAITRSTDAAGYAIGATSIGITNAGAQAITAGKHIKFAGDPRTYRVTTGVAASTAGTIVLTTPLEQAIVGATTVSVNMVDDKVTLAHPGTNNANGTAYLLNGSHSAGATTINVNTGSGTILAGECIQLEHQLGTDEDGQPYYDNTYYKVAVSLTAGVITIDAPGLNYAMASGVKVVNRGHVVTLNDYHTWGDDTSSTTAASNGIVVLGTLRASRSTSHQLTARGTIFYGTGGTVDFGDPDGDPIPDGVSSTLILNDSATLATGKHGMTSHLNGGVTMRLCGTDVSRNTELSGGISVGGSSIQVADATGWKAGGTVVLASDTDDFSRAQVVTLSGGPTTWGISPSSLYALPDGHRVGYFSSNVTVKAAAASAPSPGVSFHNGAASLTSRLRCRNVSFFDVGNNGTGWSGFSNSPPYYGAIGVLNPANRAAVANDCSAMANSSAVGCPGPSTHVANAERSVFKRWAIYAGASSVGAYFGGNSVATLSDSVVYRSGSVIQSGFESGGIDSRVIDCAGWGSTVVTVLNAVDLLMQGGSYHGTVRVANVGIGSLIFEGAQLSAPKLSDSSGTSYSGLATYRHCSLSSPILTASITSGSIPSQLQRNVLVDVNVNPDDNRDYSYYRFCTTDTTLATRKRSTYSVKIQPKVANTAITYTFTLPAVSGVAQKIKGSLQYDATYGTATPPSIVLSGQGVTNSFTAGGTADVWHDFAFDFTPTSTGDVTATVTVQSTSTSGFVWLDGIYHYPMTQSARHFGYQFLAQTALVADPKIAVTNEATVLAYPVTVDHTTDTITVTADATATQIADYLAADLCQTANQGEAVHYTLGVGGAFTTSYAIVVNTGVTVTGSFTTSSTVTLTGTGDVDGTYTDSAGLHVKITAPNLVDGTWCYIYNVTDSTVVHHAQVSGGAGLSLPVIYTADKTISYRFAYSDATVRKNPISGTGVLGASGLSIIDSQTNNTVYADLTGDPATFTEFEPDFPNLQINILGGGSTTIQRLLKWVWWAEASEDGIELMFGAVNSTDGINVEIDTNAVDAMIDNPNDGTVVTVTGGVLSRSDGTAPVYVNPTHGVIYLYMGKAYLASAGTLAADVWTSPTRTLTDGAAANVSAIKAKTDNLPSDPADASDIAAAFSAAAVTAAAIKAKTDNLPAAPAAVSDIPTAAQNADKLLGRNLAAGSDGGRTVKDALRASRNKTEIAGSTLTVYEEDDATPAWTAGITTTSRDALSGIDPA